MFDTHVHLDAPAFAHRLDEAAHRMGGAGVTGALNPAVDLASSQRALAIHRAHPWVRPGLGFHPLYLGDMDEPPVAELEELIDTGEFKAVGEVGLDFWEGRDDEARQRDFLAAQAKLAQRRGLPLCLHIRKGFYETLTVLQEAGFTGPAVCHAFGGSREMAHKALDAGFHLSASATLTYPRKQKLRELFASLPPDRILVETDAPDLPPWEKRGETHEPWDLPRVVQALAEARGELPAEVGRYTMENAERLFG